MNIFLFVFGVGFLYLGFGMKKDTMLYTFVGHKPPVTPVTSSNLKT